MKTKLFILLILICSNAAQAQKTSGKYAVIEFVGENNNYSRTYLGKVKKGDLNRLNDYLEQPSSNSTNDQSKDKDFAPKEFKSKKDRNKIRYLSDTYNIDENKLKKRKPKLHQKYLEEKEKAYSEKEKRKAKKVKNPNRFSLKVFLKGQNRQETKLSKQYKIRGKRLRKGTKLKYREGNVSLIIKYEIREGRSARTYVTNVNSSVKSGSKYYLKYNGNGTKRKYFLERAHDN